MWRSNSSLLSSYNTSMKTKSEQKVSNGFNFGQQDIKTKIQPPSRTSVKKPPAATNANTRFKANEAILNDLFAVGQPSSPKKTPPKKLPPLPKKKESLRKSNMKRPTKLPSASLIEKSARILEDESNTETLTKCPYCHETLASINQTNNVDERLPPSTALPPVLQLELDKIKADDKRYHEERMEQQYMDNLPKRRFVSNMDQFRFCQLHRLELTVKPEGIRQGYPIDLDFTALGIRVEALQAELEKVIHGDIDSPYRTIALAAYQDMGLHMARNTMGMMARFEKTLPGYYGSKGASIIMNKINDMFLHTGILTRDKTHPQLPLEYVQQVLVPETGWRLIQQDLIKKGLQADQTTTEKAREIMAASVDFGSMMYPGDEETSYPMEHNGNDTDISDEGGQDETAEPL